MEPSKKTLLVDANFCCLPVLFYLQQNGFDVSVCGNKREDPCHLLAANSYIFDYSNKDDLNSLSEKKFDYIVAGCNDASYISSSFLANKLGLPGYDNHSTALTLLHKDKFREFAELQHYPVPKATRNIADAKNLTFPLIVKPIDSFSGRGISIVNSANELENNFENAAQYSSTNTAVIEEFIDGSLHSHSAFIKNGKVICEFFVDEFCTVYPYQVNSSCLSTNIPDQIKPQITQWCESLARDLNLCDGLVHTQFIYKENSFWIIEVTRRCPGDLYSELIQESTGINYTALYASSFTGKPLPDYISPERKKYVARHTLSCNSDQIFLSNGIDIPNTRYSFFPVTLSGEKILSAPFGKSGIFFIEFKSMANLRQYTPVINKHVLINSHPA